MQIKKLVIMNKKKSPTYEELTRPAPAGDLPPFPPEENEFCEIHWGNTPSGGDLSIGYFFDKDGNKCTRANAARINIIEYTKSGERLNEHYSFFQ